MNKQLVSVTKHNSYRFCEWVKLNEYRNRKNQNLQIIWYGISRKQFFNFFVYFYQFEIFFSWIFWCHCNAKHSPIHLFFYIFHSDFHKFYSLKKSIEFSIFLHTFYENKNKIHFKSSEMILFLFFPMFRLFNQTDSIKVNSLKNKKKTICLKKKNEQKTPQKMRFCFFFLS